MRNHSMGLVAAVFVLAGGGCSPEPIDFWSGGRESDNSVKDEGEGDGAGSMAGDPDTRLSPGDRQCVDRDGDGFCSDSDCDDDDFTVHPHAIELCGDGKDNNCDGKDTSCPRRGDLLVSEIMFDPQRLDDETGEWIEIFNASRGAINLEGLVLRDESSDLHVIGRTVMVQPGAFAVLAISRQATEGVDYVYQDVSLANDDDEIILATLGPDGAEGETLQTVRYQKKDFPEATGASLSLDPRVLSPEDGATSESWCVARVTFDTGDRGTPGAANMSCSDYGLSWVSPTEGLDVGGLEVTLNGVGLADTREVLFGGEAVNFRVISSSEIRASTAEHEAGWVDVSVVGPEGRFDLPQAFLFTGTESAIGWCNVQWPVSTTTGVGVESPAIYGRVFLRGVTESVGPGAGVLAELGYGPLSSNPVLEHGWMWFPAHFNIDHGANDEFMGSVTVDAVGSYAYAYRFSADDGLNWLYCDTNGSSLVHREGPYNPREQGVLEVRP